jgi:hypothetical protein
LDFFSSGERTRKSSNGNFINCNRDIRYFKSYGKRSNNMVIAHDKIVILNRRVILFGNAV